MKKLFLIMVFLGSLYNMVMGQDSNPFFNEWNTPFGVPPFSKIKNEHYMPAFLEGIKRHQEEIDAIISNREAPTFENTILAFDKSGEFLEKVSSVFSSLNGANTNDEMQAIAKQLSPITTQHSDDINLNEKLFKRIKTVQDQLDNLKLDLDQARLVDRIYKNFVRGGANLGSENKKRLRELNKEINMLQLTFGQNLLAENNAYKMVIDNKADLAGLPDGVIAAASEQANRDSLTQGKWVFTLQNPSVMPFLQYADKRELRNKIFNAYINRCNNNNKSDNKEIIVSLVNDRLNKAKLLGYPSFAHFVLEDRMAKTPENVYALLNKIWRPAISTAITEAKDMEPMMYEQKLMFGLEAWDWRYCSEKMRKLKFDLEEAMLKPYFKLENVRDGVFYVANRLYGVTFTQIKDAPIYDPSVTLWECRESGGKHLGILYFDFFPRAGKRGGAWCGSFRPQSYKDGKRVAPVMTIVTNFTPPTNDAPALLTTDEVNTLFHEFGHALAGLFKDVKYSGIASVPRDFVELPSQIMEHWAFEPDVLKVYAKHYKTGEVIPTELVDKINKSEKFGQGFKTAEYLAASFLDMDYHTLTEPRKFNVNDFENESKMKIFNISQIPPRYRSTYFQHSMT